MKQPIYILAKRIWSITIVWAKFDQTSWYWSTPSGHSLSIGLGYYQLLFKF